MSIFARVAPGFGCALIMGICLVAMGGMAGVKWVRSRFSSPPQRQREDALGALHAEVAALHDELGASQPRLGRYPEPRS